MVKSRQLKVRRGFSPLAYAGQPAALLVLATLTVIAAYIVIALMNGPDTNWDLRNYHYYNGYVFLHGVFEHNLFPAQTPTWFNPLLDAFQVFLTEHLPPMLTAVTLALLQSLNVPLLALLLWQCVSNRRNQPSKILPIAALLIGAFGVMTLSQLGKSFGDDLITVPLLGGLVALGRTHTIIRQRPYYAWTGLAGFCLGIAIGLKLTAAIFAPGFLLCLITPGLRSWRTYGAMFVFATAALIGLMITDGFWLDYIWRSTGNPFFPALNGFFHSRWIGVNANLLDLRFRPKSFADLLQFPLKLLRGEAPGSEAPYYDLHFVLIWLAFPFLLYLAVTKKLCDWPLILSLFFYAGFAVWMVLFGIMRYAVPLEYLSGVILVIAICVLPSVRLQALGLSALALLLLLTTQTPLWGPHLAWDDVKQGNWFAITVPDKINRPDAMFLMLTGEATSYVIPSFDSRALFVRMEGNINPTLGTVLYDIRLRTLERHRGPIFTLAPNTVGADESSLLNSYNFQRSKDPCVPITTNIEVLFVCPVERI